MKLRVLGRYGRFPVGGAGTSSFLVETSGAKIVFDMGCSSLSNLLKFRDINDIDAVILSHLHGDHIADFKTLTYMTSILKGEGRLKHDLTVYLPKTPEWLYKDLISSRGMKLKVLEDGMKDTVGDVRLSFFKLVHPVETYGVRLSSDKVLSYTADTLLCDNLKPLIKDADLVIGDACILDNAHNGNLPHLSVRQLAEISKKNNVKKLMLAHLPDINLDKILKEAKDFFENSVLAEEDIEYTV